jgi:hypothetical protein
MMLNDVNKKQIGLEDEGVADLLSVHTPNCHYLNGAEASEGFKKYEQI